MKRAHLEKQAEADAAANAHKNLDQKYQKEQEEWKAERARLRLENTTMKGRLRAMDKLGMTEENGADKTSVGIGQQALVRDLQEKLDELREEVRWLLNSNKNSFDLKRC